MRPRRFAAIVAISRRAAVFEPGKGESAIVRHVGRRRIDAAKGAEPATLRVRVAGRPTERPNEDARNAELTRPKHRSPANSSTRNVERGPGLRPLRLVSSPL